MSEKGIQDKNKKRFYFNCYAKINFKDKEMNTIYIEDVVSWKVTHNGLRISVPKPIMRETYPLSKNLLGLISLKRKCNERGGYWFKNQ